MCIYNYIYSYIKYISISIFTCIFDLNLSYIFIYWRLYEIIIHTPLISILDQTRPKSGGSWLFLPELQRGRTPPARLLGGWDTRLLSWTSSGFQRGKTRKTLGAFLWDVDGF
jgi:hypothetical protein